MFDAVLLYAPPWAGPTRFSKHHLAAFIAQRGGRVLYVEAPLTPVGLRRGSRFASELRDSFRPPRRVADRLWVRRHFVPVPYHAATRLTSQRAANRVGQSLLAPVLRRDFARLGLRRPVLIAGLPHAADVLSRLPSRLVVYHCADDYAHVRGFPRSLPDLEADLCRRADLVVTTSETLCQSRARFNPHTCWIPNGADVEHFSAPAAPAAELRNVPHPIVGFVGGLSEWVDLDLVARLARQRPEWTFLLVGPVGIDTSAVDALPNVRLLGPRPYADLPALLAAMDVGLIPFKRNDVTYHADPIKAYEYLAAGLPVVATDMPALRRLTPLVALAESAEGFQHGIRAALEAGRDAGRAERQAEARRHGWTSRFECFERLVENQLACAS
ncbi:MAG: glycosyltransferase [Chloroflexi bacterium]|nr:glycosyltransferase [Chloroflexota bacterium]